MKNSFHNDTTHSPISEDELDAVSGGRNTEAGCDRCVTGDEFPKPGVCAGTAWSVSENKENFVTCPNFVDNGRFMRCRKCGFRRNS